MARSEFPLPQEILELVVSYVSHDIDSLRAILQVCRAFASVARQYLYREITLLDDKNDSERRSQVGRLQRRPIFTEASFLALLNMLPFIGHSVKAVRTCGSTRLMKQKTYYVTSKYLHLILPLLPSLESISFQRTRTGPRICSYAEDRYRPYMLMTAQIAKVIPPGVQAVWLDQVMFESDAAVDKFFSTCRHLAHLGLNQVSVLPSPGQRSLGSRIASAVKSAWTRVFPTAPSFPAHVEPIELRSYAHGDFVRLPRLPFTDSDNTPYFNLSSVTKLKLYNPNLYCSLLRSWQTLIHETASSVEDLMMVTVFSEDVIRSNSAWNLAGHKHLRSLIVILDEFTVSPQNLFPDSLENLTILSGYKNQAWELLDERLNEFPFISRVEIFFLQSYLAPPIGGFVDFCSSTWEFATIRVDAWKDDVTCRMPLLSDRGILNVNQFSIR